MEPREENILVFNRHPASKLEQKKDSGGQVWKDYEDMGVHFPKH